MAADPVHQAWVADLERRGAELGGEGLRPVVDATTVRVRDGETLVADGPFAETKDFVGGFVVVECADLDEAIEIAAGHPYIGVDVVAEGIETAEGSAELRRLGCRLGQGHHLGRPQPPERDGIARVTGEMSGVG